MRAISEFPTPKNIHELKRFLGLTSYFRRFLRNYAIRARPLTDLTKKTQTFTWGEDQSAAFEDLRDSLCAEPELYNPKATITELHTDACSAGVAGMLLQTDSAGQLHPVYYISKKTTDVEEKYHSTKLELMAIKHRPGGRMAHVDALSRAPVDDSQDTRDHIHERLEVLQTLDETDYVLMIQYGDAALRELIPILKKPNEERTPVKRQRVLFYKLDSARLLRNVNVNGTEKWLYVIPKSMRKSIVVKHHDQLGHFGVDRTVAKIRERYWFSKMKQYVQRHISACAECLLNKIPSGKRPGELHPPRPPRRPFEKIHLDHVGPLVKTDDENSYTLVVIDALTKFVKLYPTKSTKSNESVSALQNCIDNYGIPRLVVADQGSCFKSDEFGKFCDSLGIQVLLIPSRWPQANGQVERVMRTLIPTLMCEMDIEEQWDKKIVKVERNLNSMLNKTTGRAPFEALHGYLPVFDDGKLTKLAEGEDCTWNPPENIQPDNHRKLKPNI
ncbi:Retrovirus-related Pol polyprotein from transposon gypsy-like Protein [Tribolium castaneum]|uniref:RNA-directed DNA polymerase n=1 Tax=Tribolium castaneum TaxID=7070 RepID=D7GXX5_TRICA|nr:Retrovirus-related Pol polyprotein from transposon gypsy-like Protein [Tribolium castaneum]